ncbi:MAG TPA: hypothetical protein VF577_01545 [Allosphingosinicella sp.]|jgi:hypothetical protein
MPALLAAVVATVTAGAALASQAVIYEYDARGRLVKVVRTDLASGAKTITDYTLDKADNRTKRETKTGQ